MTPLVICALIVLLGSSWIAIDDLIWGRSRRFKILSMLAGGPIPGRDLACGRSTRYVLLGKMQDAGLVESFDLGWEGSSYQYRITDLGHAWLRKYGDVQRSTPN